MHFVVRVKPGTNANRRPNGGHEKRLASQLTRKGVDIVSVKKVVGAFHRDSDRAICATGIVTVIACTWEIG